VFAAVPFKENFVDWLWISVGVTIGVLWPWLNHQVKQILNIPTAAGINWRPVLIIGLFAALTGILVLAIYRQSKPDEDISFFAAILAGYGFEAVLEKWKTNFQQS
jgi:hypothetical protein